jgi:twitching motility two-component system response regulator PilH
MARILIVDDSQTDAQFMRLLLEKAGYQVVVAHTLEQAMASLGRELPQLILMDVVLPGASGFQATRALSKDPMTHDVPIILVSAKAQETDRVWGLRQGAKDYVKKPVDPADLLAKVKSVMAGY